jgi:tripartite-type tricarboxylate transporter receptor subunit TctC
MPMKQARFALHVLLFVLCGLAVQPTVAQPAYPDKPVKIIVPSSPGGGTDTVTRLLAQHLSDALGHNFYIENRPGAGSMTGDRGRCALDARRLHAAGRRQHDDEPACHP